MFPSCFRPPGGGGGIPTPPNITTSFYRTQSGLFGLTWSRDLLARSLHIHIHLNYIHHNNNSNLSCFPPPSDQSLICTKPSFHIQIRPWKKRGSQRLLLLPPPPAAATNNNLAFVAAQVYWDISKAEFGSEPAPASGFYVAIMIDGEMKLLVGNGTTSLPGKVMKEEAVMVLRREHVYVRNKVMLYTTKLPDFGREREISIDCRVRVGGHGAEEESRLYLSVDRKRVLEIKHLKWKFRGNQRIQVDGMPIQVSWDVHSWLFPKKQHVVVDDKDHDEEVVVDLGDGHGSSSSYALFMFKLEKYPSSSILGPGLQEEEQQTRGCGIGFENEKMNKGKGLKLLKSGGRLMISHNHWSSSSSTSSCLSSASSGCSSVMEWESLEENELKDPCGGFSLLVYAWRSWKDVGC